MDLLHEDRSGAVHACRELSRIAECVRDDGRCFLEDGFEDLVDEWAGREVDGERPIGQLAHRANELSHAARVEQSRSH